MKHESSKRGGKAIRALQKAARYANMEPQRGAVDVILNRMEVERAEAVADAMLKPTGELVAGAGEVVHLDPAESEVSRQIFADTLREPNMISVDASDQRMEAAADAGVLEAAVDAAESGRAGNSLEKMLCHQMAAAHHMAMKLLAHTTNPRLPPVEMARLTNAAARMMDAYQAGFFTLQKIRTGGKQTVVVQHVRVADGGQAVIAGSMKTGGPRGGGRRKMSSTPHEKRRGWLKNGNSPGDFTRAARCGAKTRRGTLCQCPAMANGRCRLHGGLSTGPKTAAGIDRIRRSATKHGRYAKAAREERQQLRALLREMRDTLRQLSYVPVEPFCG